MEESKYEAQEHRRSPQHSRSTKASTVIPTTEEAHTHLISSRMSLYSLVLYPLPDTFVLPCMGSHCQTTGAVKPASWIALITGGSFVFTLAAPILVMRTTLPGCDRGLGHSLLISCTISAGSDEGPTLIPTGFWMPAGDG